MKASSLVETSMAGSMRGTKTFHIQVVSVRMDHRANMARQQCAMTVTVMKTEDPGVAQEAEEEAVVADFHTIEAGVAVAEDREEASIAVWTTQGLVTVTKVECSISLAAIQDHESIAGATSQLHGEGQ